MIEGYIDWPGDDDWDDDEEDDTDDLPFSDPPLEDDE